MLLMKCSEKILATYMFDLIIFKYKKWYPVLIDDLELIGVINKLIF